MTIFGPVHPQQTHCFHRWGKKENKILKKFPFKYQLFSLIRQFQTGEPDFSLITPISLWGRLFEFWRAIIDSHTSIYEEKLGPEIVLCQCQITFEHRHQLIICAHKKAQAAGIIDNYSHNCPSGEISKSPVGNCEYVGTYEYKINCLASINMERKLLKSLVCH